MSRLITCISIFVLILAASIASLVSLRFMTRDVIAMMEEAKSFAAQGDEKLAAESAKKTTNTWIRYSSYISTFINHDNIDIITGGFGRLTSYAEAGMVGDFIAECDSIILQLQELYEKELPVVTNIF